MSLLHSFRSTFGSYFGCVLVPVLDTCSSFLRMSKNQKNDDSSIYGAHFCLSKNLSVESKTGLVWVSIWDCVLTVFWTQFWLHLGSLLEPAGLILLIFWGFIFWSFVGIDFYWFWLQIWSQKYLLNALFLGVRKSMGSQRLSKASRVSFWTTFGLPLASFLASYRVPFCLPFRSFDLPLVPFRSRIRNIKTKKLTVSTHSRVSTLFGFPTNQATCGLCRRHMIWG